MNSSVTVGPWIESTLEPPTTESLDLVLQRLEIVINKLGDSYANQACETTPEVAYRTIFESIGELDRITLLMRNHA